MTTSTWTSARIHDSDANFRIWGSEFSAKLQAIGGLTVTGDTGQINWVTVTRPGTNTDAGYEVYYLNDSLHSTAPIYFKIYYGTGTNASYPRIRVEIGTGSNGTGTLTGTGSGTVYTASGSSAGSGVTYPSYLCVATGFFGIGWKIGAANPTLITICRTCDNDGTANGKGAFLTYGTLNPVTVPIRYEATAAVYTAGPYLSLVPVGGIAGLISGDYQVYLCWGAIPDVRPIQNLLCVFGTDITNGTTFSATTVGASAKTFISVAQEFTQIANASSSVGVAFLWQ